MTGRPTRSTCNSLARPDAAARDIDMLGLLPPEEAAVPEAPTADNLRLPRTVFVGVKGRPTATCSECLVSLSWWSLPSWSIAADQPCSVNSEHVVFRSEYHRGRPAGHSGHARTSASRCAAPADGYARSTCHQCYLSLHYVLLFPNGDWHSRCRRPTGTADEAHVARLPSVPSTLLRISNTIT